MSNFNQKPVDVKELYRQSDNDRFWDEMEFRK